MIKQQNLWVKVVGLVLLVAVVPLSFVFAQEDDVAATEEANKEIVLRLHEEGFTTGDIDVLRELMSPDFIEHEEGSPLAEDFSIELMSEVTSMLASAITDFEIEVIDIIAEGDKVAVIGAWTGTHEGEFMGMPATGNEIYIPVFDLFRVEDGLIVEHWGVTDNLAFMSQFGAIPMPEME